MDLNVGTFERGALPLLTSLGAVVPHLPIPGVLSPAYAGGSARCGRHIARSRAGFTSGCRS